VLTVQCEVGERGMAAGKKGAVIPMQMIMIRGSKKRRFPVQMLHRLLRGSMPRRLHKTHRIIKV